MSYENEISYDSVIPSAILFNENLEPACIKLFALIKGLTRVRGYCWASNAYLGDLLKVDVSTIKRWLISLQKEGYVEIHTISQGIKKSRSLYISDNFKKSLRRLKNEPPPQLKNEPILEDKDLYKKTTTSPTPSSSVKAKSAVVVSSIEKELKKSCLKREELKEAIEFYRENTEKVEKKDNPVGWIIYMVKSGNHAPFKELIEREKKRRSWAKKRAETYSPVAGAMEVTKDCVVLISGNIEKRIKFTASDPFWNEADALE